MPELPEVEQVARTLWAHINARTVLSVDLRRRDVCETMRRGRRTRTTPHDLLEGATIADVGRRGKQIAITATDGRVLSVHLGMTGHVTIADEPPPGPHNHCTWRLGPPARGTRSPSLMVFTDPRRFGGLWTFESPEELHRVRWSGLGPDALTITAADLVSALKDSKRAVKAALLDQAVLAGVGNIYADEALFRSGIAPHVRAGRIKPHDLETLAAKIRSVLAEAVEAGGSTLRDYVDANNSPGTFQLRHLVYGRAGQPCVTCQTPLKHCTIAQRTTVYCPVCQAPARRSASIQKGHGGSPARLNDPPFIHNLGRTPRVENPGVVLGVPELGVLLRRKRV